MADSLAVVITILVAFLGWLVTFLLAERQRSYERRTQEDTRSAEARIQHLNAQLENLYGPLYAKFIANDASWEAFVDLYFKDFNGLRNADETQKRIWRAWVVSVFQPINKEMTEVITENAHLIDGDAFPKGFFKLLAHEKAWRGVIAQWNSGIDVRDESIIVYPVEELREAIVPVYKKLLAKREEELLKHARRSSANESLRICDTEVDANERTCLLVERGSLIQGAEESDQARLRRKSDF